VSSHLRPLDQRAALCDALAAVEPTAPTLCEGWTAHHLAAHVWLRENLAFGQAADLVTGRRERIEQRLADVMAERSYAGLVAAIRRGPSPTSPFRLPGLEAALNTIEFFVHCEDVRRGAGVNTPRPRDAALEVLAWRRVPGLARIFLRGCPVAVWIERDVPPGDPVRIGTGPDIVTIAGPASEVLLYLNGRRRAANVALHGEPAALAVVERARLGF
jgi:uncharacterized protein (TIGR03085 family)